MNSDLQIINPINYPEWDDLLLSNKEYSIFYSSGWAKVLHESYGYKPLYFTVVNNNKLQTLLPFMEVKSILTGNRGVSLPFTDYCEPIVFNGMSYQGIINDITKYGKKAGWRFVEMRGGSKLPKEIPDSSFYYGHDLDLLESRERKLSKIRDNTKRNIKKALREGVGVTICNSLESVKEFYRLNIMTRKEHGLPPQPFYFFKKIHEHIISKNHGMIVLASHKKRNVAGAIFFYFGKKAIYKYGASDGTYQHLRANNLVIWEAIEWLSLNGYKSLSFGRTDPENEGLKRFKKGWGTNEWIIRYYKYDVLKRTFMHRSPRITEFQKTILRKVPPFLLRPTGALLYRHIG